jgi:hypothetical protein
MKDINEKDDNEYSHQDAVFEVDKGKIASQAKEEHQEKKYRN